MARLLKLSPVHQEIALCASHGTLEDYAMGLRARIDSTRWYEPLRKFHLERQLIECQFAIECYSIGVFDGLRSPTRG